MPAAALLLRSWVRIPPGAWIFVCCECRVLSGRGLCDELITRPEESYRLSCVVVCDLETWRIGAPYMYDISSLRDKNIISYQIISYHIISYHILYHVGAVKPTIKLSGNKLARFLNRIHGQKRPFKFKFKFRWGCATGENKSHHSFGQKVTRPSSVCSHRALQHCLCDGPQINPIRVKMFSIWP